MKYLKYEFTLNQWEESKKLIKLEVNQPLNGAILVWNNEIVTSLYEVGHIEITPAVFEDIEIVTPAVLSPLWAVDIIWTNEPLAEFEPYIVWPSPPSKHNFGGWSNSYEESYESRNV
jgi:hypothetical protein